MADVIKTSNFNLTASDRYILGDVWDGEPGGIAIQIENVSSLLTTFTVQGRCRNTTDQTGTADAAPWVNIPYKASFLNGAIAANAIASAAITGASLIYVEAPGYEIALNNTFTSGDGAVYFQKVRGGGGL